MEKKEKSSTNDFGGCLTPMICSVKIAVKAYKSQIVFCRRRILIGVIEIKMKLLGCLDY